ncbi:MAG: hypothetical protein M3N53_06630 [Actinomycetota bacterium]|nr:hypothetical protein [Actinomycetota bacterium]
MRHGRGFANNDANTPATNTAAADPYKIRLTTCQSSRRFDRKRDKQRLGPPFVYSDEGKLLTNEEMKAMCKSRSIRTATLGATALLMSLPAASPAQAAPTCFGREPTIIGNDSRNRLTGTPGADVIMGEGGDDVIFGRGGDDLICGGGGNDEMLGGRGNDRIRGNRSAGATGHSERLLGGVGRDLLMGNGGEDDLVGGPGRDRLIGGRGSDTAAYYTAKSGVSVDLGRGVATGDGRDRLYTMENATGSDHDDVIIGNGGDNYLGGDYGRDLVIAKGGNDRMSGDGIYEDGSGDVLRGGAGDDYASGDYEPDSGGPDRIYGGDGNDSLYGGPADDLIDGGDGIDLIRGGPGDDVCRNGEDVERC